MFTKVLHINMRFITLFFLIVTSFIGSTLLNRHRRNNGRAGINSLLRPKILFNCNLAMANRRRNLRKPIISRSIGHLCRCYALRQCTRLHFQLPYRARQHWHVQLFRCAYRPLQPRSGGLCFTTPAGVQMDLKAVKSDGNNEDSN